MTRATHVTHGQTAARLEKLRKLVTALLDGQLTRDELLALLKVGPSGAQKYLRDLRGMITATWHLGAQVIRLAVPAEKAHEFLAGLALQQPARAGGGRSGLEMASRDTTRHFHILDDDEPYPVRVSRTHSARDPLVAALFGPALGAVEARA